jgi:hypothetical protein
MAKRHNDYYTYAFLREDRTPYYIGKGRGKRIYSNQRRIKVPKDKSRIIYLKKNLSEAEAFKHEIYMIAILGRKDIGTGILRNCTDGGEGASGRVVPQEVRERISNKQIGKRMSELSRKRMSSSQRGNKNACGTRTEECKRNNSIAQTGKKLSKEHKQIISKKLLNRKKSPEHSRKIGLSKVGNQYVLGRKWWVSCTGETCLATECPGPEWQRGRKWRG